MEQLAKTKILVVDDEPHIVKQFSRYLRERGCHQIRVAGDGAEAFAAIASFNADVIVMDYKMDAGVDGYRTALAILDLYGIPSVFVTAFDKDLVREKFSHQFAIVEKPIHDPEKLTKAIESTLQSHRIQERDPEEFRFATDRDGKIVNVGAAGGGWLEISGKPEPDMIAHLVWENLGAFLMGQEEGSDNVQIHRSNVMLRSQRGEALPAEVESEPILLKSSLVGFTHSVRLNGIGDQWEYRNSRRIQLLTKSIKERKQLTIEEHEELRILQIEAKERIAAKRDLNFEGLRKQ